MSHPVVGAVVTKIVYQYHQYQRLVLSRVLVQKVMNPQWDLRVVNVCVCELVPIGPVNSAYDDVYPRWNYDVLFQVVCV